MDINKALERNQSPSPSTTSPSTPSPTIALNDTEGFILIYSVNYVFILLNLISVVFILVRIFLRWRSNKRKFSMALRVPLYLGLMDVLLLTIEFINIIYPTVYLKIIPQPYCSLIAGLNIGIIYFTRFMVAGIAIITYLRVCRKVYYNYGTYDWKIWLIAGIASTLLTASGYKSYGPTEYWCAARISSTYVPIFSLILSISVIGTCTFCYYNTIMEIRGVKKNTSNFSNTTNNYCKNILSRTEQIEARVTRKVAGYILVFILQWIPSFPYEISIIMDKKEIWTFILVVASINLGGIGNAIFYVLNEGWTSEGRDSTLGTESSDIPKSSNNRNKNHNLSKASEKSSQNTSEITIVNVDVTTTTQITTINNDKNV
ncbi:7506_t:CDS:10 [Diversispora eburnea]|uniref:7506_t:CDS:1 n=1 Tax=Diversispora eburnea TaxID=1213867 RepID=A0A9N9FWB9_9GLOM|nr:7506_t:CDS:10 [Diversispora eburnea]